MITLFIFTFTFICVLFFSLFIAMFSIFVYMILPIPYIGGEHFRYNIYHSLFFSGIMLALFGNVIPLIWIVPEVVISAYLYEYLKRNIA